MKEQPEPTQRAFSGWDAGAYTRLAAPQFAWGSAVLDRLALSGDELVLDAGCGSGHLTALLLERLPRGRVIAVDASPAMLSEAQSVLAHFGDRVALVRADLAELQLSEAVDVVFSTATFHWIRDHDRLFSALARALRPGGLLEAQCGGGPNLTRLLTRLEAAIRALSCERYFSGWAGPWLFATEEATARRLARAGFTAIVTSTEAAPVHFATAEEFSEFVRKVVLWPYLERLPRPLADRLMASLVGAVEADRDAFVVDYWRLNVSARRR